MIVKTETPVVCLTEDFNVCVHIPGQKPYFILCNARTAERLGTELIQYAAHSRVMKGDASVQMFTRPEAATEPNPHTSDEMPS